MGIDPVTHKPISKILSDYETISCLTTNHQMRSLDKNLATSFSSQCTLSPPTNPGIQFQNATSFNHHMLEEVSPSSSSSSSSSISNGKSSSHLWVPTYSWREKTVVDPPLSTDMAEEDHNYQGFLAEDLPPQILKFTDDKVTDNMMTDWKTAAKNAGTSSSCYDYEPSSVNSFVKALLDRDSEIQLEFPAFNDILDY